MSPPAEFAAGDGHAPRAERRRAMTSPLTTILGRAQLLSRAVQRSPSLTEAERTGMLAGLGTIEAAVYELVRQVDALDAP